MSFVHGPIALRSYDSRYLGKAATCKIWEAARATTAATAYFAPMNINGVDYIDAGIYWNNPIKHLLQEAHGLWSPVRHYALHNSPDALHLSCIISIGTGQKHMPPIGSSHFRAESRRSMCAWETTEWFRREYAMFFDVGCFRFDIDGGFGSKFDLDAWKPRDRKKMLDKAREYTRRPDVAQSLSTAAKILIADYHFVRRKSPLPTLAEDGEYVENLEEISPGTSCTTLVEA
jgi:hypothetical protein